MKNLIDIRHHVHDYECMWNGIEDIYMKQTGESLPDNFFFLLSGFGSFCYLKTEKAELKRMVALGDGRTKKMYEFLAPIVGFEYKHYPYKTFGQALKKAKREINTGYPVVLGALDMYYLPYFQKLYHREHIPFHYVLMTGYDDEAEQIYLHDCSRSELLPLSYDELLNSMNCSYPGLSKPNTVCTIRMTEPKSKLQIAVDSLVKKGQLFLNPPVNFLGYKGFEKFILELPNWKQEMSCEDYDRILTNMVMFFGTVPTVPNVLRGIDEPDSVVFRGGFDKMSRMLSTMGNDYKKGNWIKAAEIFGEGADVIESISTVIINYLSGKSDETSDLPVLFSDVLKVMKTAYALFLQPSIY